jgi:hypothetical protein
MDDADFHVSARIRVIRAIRVVCPEAQKGKYIK